MLLTPVASFGQMGSLPKMRTKSVRFGNNYDRYEPDPYDPHPDKREAEGILAFKAPKPKWIVQQGGLFLNRIIALPKCRVTPVIAPEEQAKLRSVGPNTGNILVGPHPDGSDGNLMINMYRLAGKIPGGFFMFMASEPIQKKNALSKQLLNWFGIIPIRRGKSNPEAVGYLTKKVSEGSWGGIFPEGAIYYSRQVMPMEYGALRIGVEAALKVQEDAKKRGITPDKMRPIQISPFAHIYVHTNVAEMKAKMLKDLEEFEKNPAVFNQVMQGPLIPRIKQAASRLMETRAETYGVKPEVYADPDIYERARKLQEILLAQLEQKYTGSVDQGYARRRAMKIRMMAYEQLKTPNLADDKLKELKNDIEITKDIITLVSFDPSYKKTYNDIETWGEFLRRLRSTVGLKDGPFGHRNAYIKVLPTISMHPIAQNYVSLPTKEAQMDYLFEETNKLQNTIQAAVQELWQAHPTEKVDA